MADQTAIFDKQVLQEVAARLSDALKSPELISEALTHPSIEGVPSYQRLEYLGDRVLSLVIAGLLFSRFPGEAEGQLSKRHAQLVRRDTLAHIGKGLGLDDYIETAAGRGRGSHLVNARVIGDVLEAMIGAIYLESGFDAAQSFIEQHWQDRLSAELEPDSKTALQEWAQSRGHGLPDYNLLKKSGPDHEPTFRIRVRLRDLGDAVGEGASKQEAEQVAAEQLLKQLISLGERESDG